VLPFLVDKKLVEVKTGESGDLSRKRGVRKTIRIGLTPTGRRFAVCLKEVFERDPSR